MYFIVLNKNNVEKKKVFVVSEVWRNCKPVHAFSP